jgi:hypothetical protein
MTYAGPFGVPQLDGQIFVQTASGALRVSSAAFDTRRTSGEAEESKMRGLLREVVAIRKAGKKR